MKRCVPLLVAGVNGSRICAQVTDALHLLFLFFGVAVAPGCNYPDQQGQPETSDTTARRHADNPILRTPRTQCSHHAATRSAAQARLINERKHRVTFGESHEAAHEFGP